MVPTAFQWACLGIGAIAVAALIPAVLLQLLFENTALHTATTVFLAIVIVVIVLATIVAVGSIGVAALGIAF